MGYIFCMTRLLVKVVWQCMQFWGSLWEGWKVSPGELHFVGDSEMSAPLLTMEATAPHHHPRGHVLPRQRWQASHAVIPQT